MADTTRHDDAEQLFGERGITITVAALAEGWPLTIAFVGYTVEQVLRSLRAKGLTPQCPQEPTGSPRTNGKSAQGVWNTTARRCDQDVLYCEQICEQAPVGARHVQARTLRQIWH